MPVVRDALTAGQNTSGDLTFSHAVGAGLDRHLLVIVAWRHSTSPGTVTGITYDGVALSFIAGETRSNGRVEAWGLVAPPVGTANVVIDFSEATIATGCDAIAVSHTGVHQTTPVGTPVTSNGTGNPSNVATSMAGGLVFDGLMSYASGLTLSADSGQTEDHNQQAGSGNARLCVSHEAGAASVTMSWTYSFSSPGWAQVVVPLIPALSMVGTPTSGGNNGSSISTSLPTGVTEGDLIVLFVSTREFGYSGPIEPAGGYTLVQESYVPDFAKGAVFYKIAGSSESAPTVAMNATVDYKWGIVAVRGADGTTPVLDSAQELDTGFDEFTDMPEVEADGGSSVWSLVGVLQGGNNVAILTWPSGWSTIIVEPGHNFSGRLFVGLNEAPGTGTIGGGTIEGDDGIGNSVNVHLLVQAGAGDAPEPPEGALPMAMNTYRRRRL